MIWNDKEIVSVGDLINSVVSCTSPEEAAEFIRLYKMENDNAENLIGYLTGYLSKDEKHRIQELFNVEHPIFGKTDPTTEEAFNAGIKFAKMLIAEEEKE